MKIFVSLFLFAFVLLLGACQEQNSSTVDSGVSSDVDPLAKGKAIASATFVSLSSNLQQAMQQGGIQNAISYCNVAAIPLTDSLSKVHSAEIRRTALRVRNPVNQPSSAERKQLEAYQAAQAAGEALQPVVQNIDAQTVAFYAPIQMMPLCEKCHGSVGGDIAVANYNLIKQLYPTDEGINFTTGDLRGMWSIQFKR
jgi:hypothetical protein